MNDGHRGAQVSRDAAVSAPADDPATNAATSAASVHATTVALGEHGVLIRGASGMGKSALALGLIHTWSSRGGFARLVADDRTLLCRCGERLIARPPEQIAGKIEVRGKGIVAVAALNAVRLSLVVDLVADPVRFPDDADAQAVLRSVCLPCLPLVARNSAENALTVWCVLHANGLTPPSRGAQRGGQSW